MKESESYFDLLNQIVRVKVLMGFVRHFESRLLCGQPELVLENINLRFQFILVEGILFYFFSVVIPSTKDSHVKDGVLILI